MVSQWNFGGGHFRKTAPWGYGSRIGARLRSLVRDDGGVCVDFNFKQPARKVCVGILAARLARGLTDRLPSLLERGRRESRVPIAPMGPVQKSTGVGPQVNRSNPAFPAAMVYGLLRDLPGDRLVATVIPEKLA